MIVYRRAATVEIAAVLHGKRDVKRLLNTRMPRDDGHLPNLTARVTALFLPSENPGDKNQRTQAWQLTCLLVGQMSSS